MNKPANPVTILLNEGEKVKMSLQEKIKGDMTYYMSKNDKPKTDALKVIISELQRQKTKQLTDEQVIKILKSLLKSEEDRLSYIVKEELGVTSMYREVLMEYLPKQVSEEEITQWIKDNIDFSELKNKMQAVGIVMKHFGTKADGNTVKNIIQNME